MIKSVFFLLLFSLFSVFRTRSSGHRPRSKYTRKKKTYNSLTHELTNHCIPTNLTDISAAEHADLLFVKEKEDGENDLATYCIKEHIKHVLFKDFADALPVVRDIVDGLKTIDEITGGSSTTTAAA